MRVQLEIKSIECKKTTTEWTKDEIYVAAITGYGTTSEDAFDDAEFSPADVTGKLLGGAVSTVRSSVKKGQAWKPTINLAPVDIPDGQPFFASLVLIEKDSGKLLGEMQQAFETSQWPVPLESNINFKTSLVAGWKVIKETVANIKSENGLVGIGIEVFKGVFSLAPVMLGELSKDDQIEARAVAFDLSKPEAFLAKSSTFQGRGSRYEVHYQVSKIA